MNTVIERLLSYYPDGYDKQPHDVPALIIDGKGKSSFSLSDLSLYVNASPSYSASVLGVCVSGVNANSTLIDLHGKAISLLVSEMPTGSIAVLLQDGPSELLLNATGSGFLPTTLTIATSPLWQIFASISRVFTGRRRSLQSAVNQINMRASAGMWLDFWGESLVVPRLAGEPDQLYVARLVGTTLEPNVNNTAIEQLFLNLGYTGSIVDIGNKSFQVNLNFPTVIPSGFIYSQAQLAQIANQVKAAGTIAIINFLESISDSMSISDSVSAISPGGPMVWGTSKWGEANWA